MTKQDFRSWCACLLASLTAYPPPLFDFDSSIMRELAKQDPELGRLFSEAREKEKLIRDYLREKLETK